MRLYCVGISPDLSSENSTRVVSSGRTWALRELKFWAVMGMGDLGRSMVKGWLSGAVGVVSGEAKSSSMKPRARRRKGSWGFWSWGVEELILNLFCVLKLFELFCGIVFMVA